MKETVSIKTSNRKDGSLVGRLNGATRSVKRKAFKHDLPVAIFENGKVYLIYADKTKVEATPDLLEKYNAQ
jgi:hypothetical protein